MCLDLALIFSCLASSMVPILSWSMSTGWCKDCPSEESRCLRKEDSCTAEDKAMYSASHVDKAIVDCCLLCQEIKFLVKKKVTSPGFSVVNV